MQEVADICFPVDGSDASPLVWGKVSPLLHSYQD